MHSSLVWPPSSSSNWARSVRRRERDPSDRPGAAGSSNGDRRARHEWVVAGADRSLCPRRLLLSLQQEPAGSCAPDGRPPAAFGCAEPLLPCGSDNFSLRAASFQKASLFVISNKLRSFGRAPCRKDFFRPSSCRPEARLGEPCLLRGTPRAGSRRRLLRRGQMRGVRSPSRQGRRRERANTAGSVISGPNVAARPVRPWRPNAPPPRALSRRRLA